LAKSPRASGTVIRYTTLSPPDDSPAIVTFDASPPKAPMLRWIQRSASTWSSTP
jgi:hypothetical protein